MCRVAREDPLLAHDYTEMRATAMRQLSAPYGEDVHVDGIMQVYTYVIIRSCVELSVSCLLIAEIRGREE